MFRHQNDFCCPGMYVMSNFFWGKRMRWTLINFRSNRHCCIDLRDLVFPGISKLLGKSRNPNIMQMDFCGDIPVLWIFDPDLIDWFSCVSYIPPWKEHGKRQSTTTRDGGGGGDLNFRWIEFKEWPKKKDGRTSRIKVVRSCERKNSQPPLNFRRYTKKN